MILQSTIHSFETLLSNYVFVELIFSISFLFKIYILLSLLFRKTIVSQSNKPIYFLILILLGSIIHDFSWILYTLQCENIVAINFHISGFINRIAWSFAFLQDFSLAFFIESLVEPHFKLNMRRKILCLSSGMFSLFFILEAIFYLIHNGMCTQKLYTAILHYGTVYSLLILILSSLLVTMHKIHTKQLPRILTKQLKILINFLIIPYLVTELLQIFPFNLSFEWINNSFILLSLSNILLTAAIYFCRRKVIGLRFLNFTNHVQSSVKYNFMNNLKRTLEQLGHVHNFKEFHKIAQNFFKETFNIPMNRTQLYIRNCKENTTNLKNNNTTTIIETFFATHEKPICQRITSSKILIYDEVAFSNYYNESLTGKSILTFLEAINADIFLPIFENNNLIAYIIVDRFARSNEFYGNVERDEMLIFASYLSNIIHLLKNRNLDNLLLKDKNLQEELYIKYQEINQYKESIRSFIRTTKKSDIGVIFYKNHRFVFGNQTAKELIAININMHTNHPLTVKLKQIADFVEHRKESQSTFAKDANGNTIVLSAVPHLEQNTVIITVCYPSVADILKKQVDIIHDPTEWDYLLYLETTQSGKLINQLIPGSGKQLLQFKINALKMALSKKAILLNVADQDLMCTVKLLHHISLREKLHTLDIETKHDPFILANELFGINPLFGHATNKKPLLETLDTIGTLFIKNIHLMHLETQEYLAEFILSGFYRMYKSNKKKLSDVRIICSSNKNLLSLVKSGEFSQQLFNQLNQTTLRMPSLVTLPENELETLAEGFTQQAIQKQVIPDIVTLSNKDKSKITTQRPTSLQELKIKTHKLLVKKNKEKPAESKY